MTLPTLTSTRSTESNRLQYLMTTRRSIDDEIRNESPPYIYPRLDDGPNRNYSNYGINVTSTTSQQHRGSNLQEPKGQTNLLPPLLPALKNARNTNLNTDTFQSERPGISSRELEDDSGQGKRLSSLSDEVDLKELLTKDPAEKAKPEAKWYQIKDIKSSLVDINCQRISKTLYEGAVDMDSAMLIPLLCGNLMRIPPSAYNVLHNPLLSYQSLVEEFISKAGTAFKETRNEFEARNSTSIAVRSLHDLERKIKNKLRSIYRTLKTSSEDEDTKNFVLSMQSHKAESVRSFQQEYDRFREAIQIQLGRTQPQLVNQAETIYRSIKMRKQQNLCIENLEDIMSKHKEKTKVLCDELNKKIEKVASDAVDVKKKSALQIKARNAILNGVNDDVNSSKKKIAKLEAEKHHTQAVYATVIDDHFKEETKLRQKKYKMETERDNWVAKYDKDMSLAQSEFDVLWVDYSAQRKILDALEEKFAVLELTYNEIIATREAEEAERTRARRELLDMNHSASVIQAFWRTRAVLKRMQLQSKRKGKGKGKK